MSKPKAHCKKTSTGKQISRLWKNPRKRITMARNAKC